MGENRQAWRRGFEPGWIDNNMSSSRAAGPAPPFHALLHFIRQRRRIERRPNSEKQKMTESGRVDARPWNPSVKKGWEEAA